MSTFEDWWVMRAQDGTENKDLARDAWFAGQKVVNDHWNAVDEARAHEFWHRRAPQPDECRYFDALMQIAISSDVDARDLAAKALQSPNAALDSEGSKKL